MTSKTDIHKITIFLHSTVGSNKVTLIWNDDVFCTLVPSIPILTKPLFSSGLGLYWHPTAHLSEYTVGCHNDHLHQFHGEFNWHSRIVIHLTKFSELLTSIDLENHSRCPPATKSAIFLLSFQVGGIRPLYKKYCNFAKAFCFANVFTYFQKILHYICRKPSFTIEDLI